MLLDDGTAGLIDFGQCVEVSDESLRMLCHIVMLLRTRNKFIISQAVAMNDDFSFNTEDLDLQLALLHYFFDTSMSGEGLVPQRALDTLEDMMQHNPKAMPVMTNVPKEMIFYGRVCATLRKSYEFLGRDVSAIRHWYPHARAALAKLNDRKVDPVSTLLLVLPENPDGFLVAVDKAKAWSEAAVRLAEHAGRVFDGESRGLAFYATYAVHVCVATVGACLKAAVLIGGALVHNALELSSAHVERLRADRDGGGDVAASPPGHEVAAGGLVVVRVHVVDGAVDAPVVAAVVVDVHGERAARRVAAQHVRAAVAR